jgi:hypothetical protein
MAASAFLESSFDCDTAIFESKLQKLKLKAFFCESFPSGSVWCFFIVALPTAPQVVMSGSEQAICLNLTLRQGPVQATVYNNGLQFIT